MFSRKNKPFKRLYLRVHWLSEVVFFRWQCLFLVPTTSHNFGTDVIVLADFSKEPVHPQFSQPCCRVLFRIPGCNQGEGVEPWGTLRIPFGKIGEP